MADTPASLAALLNTLATKVTSHITNLTGDVGSLKALATRVGALAVAPPQPPGPGPGPTPGMPPVGTVMTGDISAAGLSNFVIRGVTFNGGRIDAAGSNGGLIVDCTFNNQPSRGLSGSAINVDGATGLTIANNAFNGSQGNVIAQYNWDNITLDGNWFTDCPGPVSVTNDASANIGRNLTFRRNVVLRYVRTGFEIIGPDNAPFGSMTNLTIDGNQFLILNSVNPVAYGTGPVSCVNRGQTGSKFTNNYFDQGTIATWGPIVSIEYDSRAGAAAGSGNTFVMTGAYGTYPPDFGVNASGDTTINTSQSLPAPPARIAY